MSFNMALATELDSVSYVKIAIGGVILSIIVSVSTAVYTGLYFVGKYRELTHKNRSDKPFANGFSMGTLLRVLLEGLSLDSFFKIMTETCRNRLYTVVKLPYKHDLWLVGHPAIVKEIFGPGTSKNWVRATKDESIESLTFEKPDPKLANRAMLYTGSDSGWKHTRVALTPFFYNKDFTSVDKDMDRVICEHIDLAVSENGGNVELLNMTLTITIDLVLQLLYGTVLKGDDFKNLVKSLAGYITPGSPSLYDGTLDLPGGASCFDYHRKVGAEIGRNAKPGTLASIICASAIPEELKDENLAFFLEALTPAFASFWAICHALTDKTGEMAKQIKNDPIFRQQCIKESLRMYPPVPSLFPRIAQKDMEIPNPLYDERKTPTARSWFGSIPVEERKTIKIKKGIRAFVIPSVLHYDERFWFNPESFMPERWEKDPFLLEMKNTAATAIFEKRKTVNYGGLLSTATEKIKSKSRLNFLEEISKFFAGNKTSSNIRNFMFGHDHETFMADASYDNLAVRTGPDVMELQPWCYMPMGLGMHACLGRRLALRMVDAILYNFLDNEVTFYNGMVPSMFATKTHYERVQGIDCVYYMPADPAYITVNPRKSLSFKDKANMRVSVVDYVELRKSGIKSKKLTDLLAEAMLADDSDDSSDDEE